MPESEAKFIGVDVGGTKVAAGTVYKRKVEQSVKQPTDLTDGSKVLESIETAVAKVAHHTELPRAIGVGVPSQIEFGTGKVLASVNIPLEGVALREDLVERFGVPVYIDNDANCAALAEAQLIEDAPADYLVMVTLGTGVGGGVIIDGRIFRGATGLGVEIGHTTVEADGELCGCGRRGCVEAYCSGTALEREATRLAKENSDSPLGKVLFDKGKITGHDVVEAARKGDPDGQKAFDYLGRWLGIAIGNLVNTFEPRHLVIGGGLSEVADLYLETAEKEASKRALPALYNNVHISLARAGAEAGVLGAGMLAMQEYEQRSNSDEKK